MKIFLNKIRANFFTGVVAFLPLGITIYLVYIIMVKGNSFVLSITPDPYYLYVRHPTFGWLWRALVLIVVIIFFSFLGALTRLYLGKKALEISDRLVNKIPLVNKIYKVITQISSAMFGQQSNFFKKVVKFEYPKEGCYAIAFFTGYAKGELESDERLVNLFVPTTPNPTSGFFLMLPEADVTFLTMSTEDAMKLIISGGAFFPEDNLETLE